MRYLDAGEYGAFGLAADTGDGLVTAASAMIDAFCRRPSLGVTQYEERLRFSRDSHSVQLSHAPLAVAGNAASALVSVRVRLRHPCRERYNLPVPCLPALNGQLVSDAAVLGALGRWNSIDPARVEASADGLLEFPPHALGLWFDEAEVTYTAGFATVPDAVKVACAQIVRNAQATPALSVKRQAIDSMKMEYFSGALLDVEVQRLLLPYVSQRVG